jgi:hypothetical protein
LGGEFRYLAIEDQLNRRQRAQVTALLYSCELICGMRSGVNRGATGRMSELRAGDNGTVERCESVWQEGSPCSGLGAGDGKRLVCGSGFGLERGRYDPCSARNFLRISSARWRAAWSSRGLVGAGGDTGAELEGLGA